MADLVELGTRLGEVLLGVAAAASAYLAGRRRAPAPVLPPSARSGRRRILLVEDEPSYRALLVRLLCRGGYDVEPAGTCGEARALAGRGYALLVADQGLPDGTGADLLRELRGAARCRACGLAPRTILLSGALSPEERYRLRGAADRVEEKTGDPADIERLVAELLDG